MHAPYVRREKNKGLYGEKNPKNAASEFINGLKRKCYLSFSGHWRENGRGALCERGLFDGRGKGVVMGRMRGRRDSDKPKNEPFFPLSGELEMPPPPRKSIFCSSKMLAPAGRNELMSMAKAGFWPREENIVRSSAHISPSFD